jgi:long-chain acyl-CoA synthetase
MRFFKSIILEIMAAIGDVVLKLIPTLMKVWEILFGWLYAFISNPTQVRKDYAKVRSKPSKNIQNGDTEVTYVPNNLGNPQFIKEFKDGKCETMADAWSWAVARYTEKRLFGSRDILGEEDEVQPNGKIF